MAIDLPDSCIYQQLDNGIHEFVFQRSSRAAVDDMVRKIGDILRKTSATAPSPRYLIDNSRVNAVPLVYVRNQLKKVSENRPTGLEPGRVAILYDGTLGMVANQMLRLALSNQLHFFNPTERDEAIAWLLEAE
jgi:hypothetical protein